MLNICYYKGMKTWMIVYKWDGMAFWGTVEADSALEAELNFLDDRAFDNVKVVSVAAYYDAKQLRKKFSALCC
jgi:hypothetical protein